MHCKKCNLIFLWTCLQCKLSKLVGEKARTFYKYNDKIMDQITVRTIFDFLIWNFTPKTPQTLYCMPCIEKTGGFGRKGSKNGSKSCFYCNLSYNFIVGSMQRSWLSPTIFERLQWRHVYKNVNSYVSSNALHFWAYQILLLQTQEVFDISIATFPSHLNKNKMGSRTLLKICLNWI